MYIKDVKPLASSSHISTHKTVNLVSNNLSNKRQHKQQAEQWTGSVCSEAPLINS